jgi:hypothetical protein
MGLFGKSNGEANVVDGTDVYIVLVCSAQELPVIERLSQAAAGKPVRSC